MRIYGIANIQENCSQSCRGLNHHDGYEEVYRDKGYMMLWDN